MLKVLQCHSLRICYVIRLTIPAGRKPSLGSDDITRLSRHCVCFLLVLNAAIGITYLLPERTRGVSVATG